MSWILTRGLRRFDFNDPGSFDYRVSDIASALSNLCRFTGHTSEFYSVAEHSVLVSTLVPQQHALEGLLHDAAEAFVGDMSNPLKQHFPEFKALEKKVDAAIREKFGLPATPTPAVKQMDIGMLYAELFKFFPINGAELDTWDCFKTLNQTDKQRCINVLRDYVRRRNIAARDSGAGFLNAAAALGYREFVAGFRELTE